MLDGEATIGDTGTLFVSKKKQNISSLLRRKSDDAFKNLKDYNLKFDRDAAMNMFKIVENCVIYKENIRHVVRDFLRYFKHVVISKRNILDMHTVFYTIVMTISILKNFDRLFNLEKRNSDYQNLLFDRQMCESTHDCIKDCICIMEEISKNVVMKTSKWVVTTNTNDS